MYHSHREVILITPSSLCNLTYGDLFVYTRDNKFNMHELEFIGQIHKNTKCTEIYDERTKHYLESSIKKMAGTIKTLGREMERYRDILIDMEGE